MSLAEDFTMYYGGSYVGLKKGDDVIPFLVQEVYMKDGVLGYSQEAEEGLVFRGEEIHRGETISLDISFKDDNLILDTPNPKYIQTQRGADLWITFRPNRTTKKGITNRKIVGVNNVSNEVIIKIFSNKHHKDVIMGCYLKKDGTIFYKGLKIGEYEGDVFSIYEEASYHAKILSAEVSGCQIQLIK